MSSVQWDAEAYESVAMPQADWGRKLLERRAWRGDEAVLDAGCGPGSLVPDILQRVPNGRVLAVDKDPSMVKRAQQALAPHGARVQVQEEDLQRLSINDRFDVIFSNAVLHWISDHDAVFDTFLRHLKPGGEILLQFGGDGNLQRIRGIARQVMSAPEFEQDFRGWNPPWTYEDDSSTQERLLIAGFVEPQVALEPAPTRFDDEASFRRFCETVVLMPYLRTIAEPQRRQLFTDRFLEAVGAQGDGRVLDYVRLTVQARRSPHH